MLSPKETGEYVSSCSKMVTIDDESLASLSEKVLFDLKKGMISVHSYLEHSCHPHSHNMPEEKAVNWIFVVDTLNFCFWLPEKNKKWQISHKGSVYSGYFALCVAIKRAVERGTDMTDPKVYSQLTLKELQTILEGSDSSSVLPLMKERLDSLRQVGNVLLEKFDGSFLNCVKESKNSAQTLLRTIVTEFPCFRDESIYKGKKVGFYKRAQILVSDIWSCFEGKGLGKFDDIDSITMFADYRVPQVLVHFGVLKYSSDLYNKLKAGEILENGCDEELEIRGCSIAAVERIKERVLKLMSKDNNGDSELMCNSILVDYYLWEYRRNHQKELQDIPFHRVISIYY